MQPPISVRSRLEDQEDRAVSREAIVALGANLPSVAGGPVETLRRALSGFAAVGLAVRAASRLFATPAFPAGSGPDFVNAAVRIATRLAPHDVLAALHRIEADLGRERGQRWSARRIDLDLLAMEGLVLPDAQVQRDWQALPPERQVAVAPEQLILPHPRLQDRAFVLVPMADVAPDWCHPLNGRTVQQMLAALPPDEVAAVTVLGHF